MTTPNIQAVIYKITCKKTNKHYIGQTKTHKKTRGKWYTFGTHCRFIDHVSISKKRNTPLCTVIKKYGEDQFIIEELERCSFEDASNRESFYIENYNTLVPNGYNKQKYSKSYKSDVQVIPNKKECKCRINGIMANGKLGLVRIYVYVKGEPTQRINFSKKSETFSQSLERAKKYAYCLTDNVVLSDNCVI